MNCAIPKEQIQRVSALLLKDIQKMIDANQKNFSVVPFAQKIYSLVRKNNDENTALAYAMMVPELISGLSYFVPKVRNYLATINYSDKLSTSIEAFKNIEEVKKLIDTRTNSLRTILEIIDSQRIVLGQYEAIEDNKRRIELNTSEPVFTYSSSPNSDTREQASQIQQERVTVPTQTLRDEEDPVKNRIYKFKEKVYKQQKNNEETVPGQPLIYNGKPLYYTMMAHQNLDIELDKEYLGSGDYTSMNKFQRSNLYSRRENLTILIVTDAKGVPYLFDNEGNITEDGTGGVIYNFTRDADKIATPTNREVIPAWLELIERLEETKKYVTKNNTQVTMPITSIGSSNYDNTPGFLRDIRIDASDEQIDSEDWIRRNGIFGKFLKITNLVRNLSDEPVEAVKPYFKDVSGLTEAIIMLLSEKNILVDNINISSDTRYKYLETFFVKRGNNLLTTVEAKDRPLVTYNKSAGTVTIKDTTGKDTHYNIGDENLKSALEEVFKQNILVNINRTNFTTSGVYTDIKVENGELKVKNNSNYYSWLYNNIKVRASRPNAEGQIVALNPLFRYTLPDLDTIQKTPEVEQETAPTEEKTVEEEDNENLNSGDPDLFNLSFDDLFRATNLENAVTEEQIRDAEKWWANSPLSKVIPLNRLLSVVNSNAWATFSRSGITLYKGSSSVDIYHEAWHGFTQLYLTTEEKVKLYKEVRKKPGVFTTVNGEVVSFSDASFFQIEEYLAEQFRDYARFQNPEKASPVKNTIFRKIWNFLKALFGGTNRNAVYVDAMSVPAVAEAFEKLYFGKLLNLQPNINNSMFDVLNRAKSVKDDEEEDFDLIRQSIDGLVAKALIVSKPDGTRSSNLAFLYSSRGRIQIFEGILNTFKNKLADINKELEGLDEKPFNLRDQKRLLEIVIENFGDIESFANNKKTNGILAAYAQTSSSAISNLVVAEEDIDIEFDTDTSNNSELLQQVGDKRANSRAMKDYLPKELTTILRIIPSFRKATDKEIESESYDFSIGEEKFVYIKNKLGFPINQDFGPTLNALQKTVVGVKTYTEMLDAIKKSSNAYPVLKVIYELLPKEDTSNRALAQDIKRARILLEVVLNFHSAFDKASVEALINTKSEVLVDENRTETKPIFTSGKATNSVGNVYRRWQNIFVNVAPRVNNEAVLNINNLPREIKTFEEAFEFFERLGVQLTKTTKEVIQASKSGITLNELLDAANFMLEDIRNNPNNKKLKSNPLQAFIERSTNSKISNQRTILRKIAQIEIKYNPLFNDSIILNANGDLVSSISLHNSMTRKIMYLNESINLSDASNFNVEFSEELNPFFKYSIIREKLFYGNGSRNNLNKLELMFHVGYQQRDEYDNIENASSATDLTINEKFITDFYSFILQGYMPTLVHESKSSVYVPMITNKNGSAELYLQPKLFENTLLPDDAVRLLQRYIKAEYERIVLFKTNETYKQNQALNKNGAGEKFTAFDDILSPETKNALYADIENGLTSDDSVRNNLGNIIEDLEYYFAQVNQQNQNRYDQSAPLVPVDETELRKFNLNVKDDNLSKTLVRAYTVNYFIHRFEMNNFFYGDMAQYDHKKEAGTKYDAGAGSGGPGFISDEWVLQAINKAYPKVYSEKVMSELRPDGVVKETTSTLNTAIIQEDTGLRSVGLNEMIDTVVKLKAAREKRSQKDVRPEIVEAFEKAYGREMKIGDGHAYMPIDTYRHLKLAQNNWLPEQEALYQKIVNGEKLDANDAKAFFPTYKLQMQGNLQTDAPITALHKFSISPLIPNVHEDSLLNDIHNLMIINNIDYITYPSGSKISNLGNPTDIYENGDRNKINMSTEFTVNPVNLAYLKEVTSNSNVWKAGQTFATQMRKLIVENLYLNGVVLPDKVELVKDYLRLVDEVTKNLEKDFLDQIGWVKKGNTYSGPVERLAAFLQTQLRKKKLPEHIIKQIFVDANGNLTNDLSALPNAQTIEAIMFSTISRRLIKQKSYGEGLVQVPGSFWRKADESERKKWLGTNEFLPFYKYDPKKSRAAKAAITLHGDFIYLFQRKDLDGNIIAVYNIVEEEDGTKKKILDVEASRVKLNRLIKNDKWLDQDDNRQAISILGVRIPVQGQGSIDALEIYEFLPIGAGNIIVLPSEIVGKSGGDFDFDKLPSLFPRINKNGKIISAKKYKTRQALLDELARLEKENNLDKKDVIERVKDVIKDLKANRKVNKKTLSEIIRNLEYTKVRRKLIVEEINKIINDNRENGQLQFLPSPLQKVLSKPDYTDGDIIKALRISSKILTKDQSRSILEKFNKRLFDQITEFDRFKDESGNLDKELKSALQDKNQFDKEIEESIEDLKEIIYVIDVENNYIGALQTDLLETSLEIILSPQNYESLVTPNSTDIFDDLAKELKRLTQTYNPLLNFSEEFTGVISPTRLFESDYNLSKYEAYMTAMDALSIGAIMNTYNILLNSLKGVSPKEYVITTGSENNKEEYKIPIRMLLPKNVTKDGNISLHNTYSYRTDKKAPLVRISDIFNQMINGWVDVGKDPWIFYIQGNREITPVLMYMLMAGVPVEHAVYFVSQPIVRKFVALKKEKGASEAYMTLLGTNDKLRIITESLGNENDFELNDLKEQLESQQPDEEYQEKVLRHFFEISNVSEAFTKFSRATNVDTTRENSYLSTREREASLNELLYDGRIDRSLVEAIQNSEKSMIGSFFIGDFAIALTKSVLPFRFDARIDNFINKLSGKIETTNTEFNSLQEGYRRLSYSQTSNKATGTELLDAAFRDELVLALYQNAVRGFRLGVSDSYKGFGVSETVPVQYVDYLKKGVYLTKDKIYISASEIQRKYESLSNDFRNKEFPTIHEYARFLIERAIVELTQPDSTDSQKENRAYINSFNFYKLFQDPTLSFANVFYRNVLKKDFSEELTEQFPVLSYFLTNSKTYPGYVILDFIGKSIDEITATSYYSQLKQLKDFTAVKNRMPNLSDSNIKIINYVFTMLPQIVFLQNGFSKNVSNLVNLVDLSEVNATIQDAISSFDFSEQSLLNFANGFIDAQTRKTTVPVRQYSLAPVKITRSELVPGAFSYRLPGGETVKSNYVPSKNFRNLLFTNEQYGYSKPYDYYDLVIKQDQTGGVYVVYPSTLDPNEAARSPYLKNSQTRAKYLPISIGFKEVGDGFIEGGINLNLPAAQKPQFREVEKIISDTDIQRFNTYIKNLINLPDTFFTSDTKFKVFYNANLGKRQNAPDSSKWMLNSNNLYDLVDQETGEYYIENVDLKTGKRYELQKPTQPTTPTIQPSVNVKGINIFSGSNDPLGAALTNPTHYNPKGGTSSSKGKLVGIYKQLDKGLTYANNPLGRPFKDVEEAYFSLRKGAGATPENIKLITDLEEAKLRQYPFLVEEITKRGGIEFLEKSIHTYSASDNPETYQKKDGDSWTSNSGNIFLKTLIEAYKTVTSTQAPVSGSVEVISENYSSELLRANPNKLFLFGDNNARTGKGGQAIIRDEPNAMGISTKLLPKNTDDAFMSDKQLADNKAVIDSDIKKAKERAAREGKTIVLPKGGFGTGLAALASKAPQTFAYLNQRLKEEFGFDNVSGSISQPTQAPVSAKKENPLIAAGVKPTDMYGNAAKDIQMAEESTQFIGFQSGTAAVSSTNKYREAWGNKANTGNYTANDVIMVSGSGTFRGVTAEQIRETLTNKYKPLLDKAIAAGASFRVGNQYAKGNLSDQLIAEYLQKKGYIEEKLDGYSRWSKTTQPTQVSVSVVKPTIDLSKEWKGDLESRPVYTGKNAELVNTMRTSAAGPNGHFGNPWSEGGYAGTIKVKSVAEAAQNYKDWLLGTKFQEVKPEQRKWILDQINQGKLDGAKLLYSKKLMDRGQGSHAISLAEVVEQLRGTQAPVSAGFQEYKGGFEDKGKGTPEGDGKDKAMREVADSFVVEVSSTSPSSSLTSLKTGSIIEQKGTKEQTVARSTKNLADPGKVVMLARNGTLKNKPLLQETKDMIKFYHDDFNMSFVVGDMPGVDSQFIDYLQEIGAKFTIYHTGATSRIQISKPTQAPVSVDVKTIQPSPVVQGNTPSIEEAKKRINEQLSQIQDILSNPRNLVVMDMSLLINDILKQNTPQIAGSKVIAEYLYGELYKRFNLPVPGASKFGVMDLIIENQEGVAGETLVSEDLIGLDLDGTCFRA